MSRLASDIRRRALLFRDDAHRVFARYEGSTSHVVTLTESKRKLASLSLAQDTLFTQALQCTERGFFRAAHVLAWAAFMDFLQEKLASDGLKKLYTVRPAHARYATLDDLRENVTDHDFIKASREVKLITKSKMNSLHGLLSERNQCAHPGSTEPMMNETLGYISKLFRYIGELQPRTL